VKIGEDGMETGMEPPGKIACRPSALGQFEEIARQVGRKRVFLFLDYDGTLTPIVERPEQAHLHEEVRRILERATRGCTVAIISGRDLDDVRDRVQIAGIYYAGSHGFDIAGPRGLRLQRPKGRILPVLDEAERDLGRALDTIPGARVERKRFSIAAHYRSAAAGDVGRVQEAVHRVADAHPDLRTAEGKKVLELQPAIDWDKGKAVLWLIDVLGLDDPQVLPLYIGDDTTDEDAFRALAEAGITIRVGRGARDTQAQYVLADTGEVKGFLERWVALLDGANE
jgi:alpha,alpha-trehalase